jgi:biopolymer transport protein ExbD
MTHGPMADIKAEPNLVPLLDLVFQLIMFFMICVNFVSAQTDEDIQLPEAQSVHAFEKPEPDALILNLDHNGGVRVWDEKKPLTTPGAIKYYLRDKYEKRKRDLEAMGKKGEKVDTVVIIRPDKQASYDKFYEVLVLCKEVGYRKMQLKAYPILTKG